MDTPVVQNKNFVRERTWASRSTRSKYYALHFGYVSEDLGNIGLYHDGWLRDEFLLALSGVKLKNDPKISVSAHFSGFSGTRATTQIDFVYQKPSMIPVDPAEIDGKVLESLSVALKRTLEKIAAEVRRREIDEAACNVANAVASKIAEVARKKCEYSEKIAALRAELKAAKESVADEVWAAAYEKFGTETCDIARTKKPDFSTNIEFLGD